VYLSPTQLTCTLPAGTGIALPLFVTANNQFAAPVNAVSYAAPVITLMQVCVVLKCGLTLLIVCSHDWCFAHTINAMQGCIPSSNLSIADCPRPGNSTIFLQGIGFGAQIDRLNPTQFVSVPRVLVGTEPALRVMPDPLRPDSALWFLAPPGAALNNLVTLIQVLATPLPIIRS
jgi:hypothetical protein